MIALNIAENMLNDTINEYRKKELLLITGAMKHFTGQDSLALLDFEKAKKLKYFDPKSDSSINAGMNQYLDALFVEYEDFPQHLIDALVATEDIRFNRHSGIDARGLARVLFRTLLGGQRGSGGGMPGHDRGMEGEVRR